MTTRLVGDSLIAFGVAEQAAQQTTRDRMEMHPLCSQLGVATVMRGAVLVGLGLFLHPGLFVTGAVLALVGLVLKPPGTWGGRI